MRKQTALSVLCAFVLLLPGCEKALLLDPSPNPKSVFEHLWTDLHHRYSYFELKDIDWLDLKKQYETRIYNGMSEHELFEVLSELLFELEDGHVNLTSPFNRSRNWDWFQDFPLNYNQGIIDRNYLGKDFWITGPLRHQVIDNVLYINYRSFADELTTACIDAIVERAQGRAGVIIDVRSNGGGNDLNALRLAGAFSDEPYTYGKVRIKDGPCSECFSSWTDLTVPARTGSTYKGKVIVLTNRASYSTTTYFAEMMNVNSQVTLMGAPTGGGGGSPAFGELPNGWLYRFSATQAVAMDGRHLEIGVPVDVEIDLDEADEANGVDTIIEGALELLR
ncbi:MAG: S41 family peptidase [Owenweeksia sp.]|nr:S41 family peptidase [Owenweeksia sp.]